MTNLVGSAAVQSLSPVSDLQRWTRDGHYLGSDDDDDKNNK